MQWWWILFIVEFTWGLQFECDGKHLPPSFEFPNGVTHKYFNYFDYNLGTVRVSIKDITPGDDDIVILVNSDHGVTGCTHVKNGKININVNVLGNSNEIHNPQSFWWFQNSTNSWHELYIFSETYGAYSKVTGLLDFNQTTKKLHLHDVQYFEYALTNNIIKF